MSACAPVRETMAPVMNGLLAGPSYFRLTRARIILLDSAQRFSIDFEFDQSKYLLLPRLPLRLPESLQTRDSVRANLTLLGKNR